MTQLASLPGKKDSPFTFLPSEKGDHQTNPTKAHSQDSSIFWSSSLQTQCLVITKSSLSNCGFHCFPWCKVRRSLLSLPGLIVLLCSKNREFENVREMGNSAFLSWLIFLHSSVVINCNPTPLHWDRGEVKTVLFLGKLVNYVFEILVNILHSNTGAKMLQINLPC